MPTLKQIRCTVEFGSSHIPLPEFGTRYSDGQVETFIAVPNTDVPFSIHVSTQGYIGPGVAFFAFIDGEYHCNRNRVGLRFPGDGVKAREYETEFRLQQKEEKSSSGTFVTRDWTFAKLGRVDTDKTSTADPRFLENVGTIEIVALRCKSAFEPFEADRSKNDPPKPTQQSSSTKNKKPNAAPTSVKQPSVTKEVNVEEDGGLLGGMSGLFDGASEAREHSQRPSAVPNVYRKGITRTVHFERACAPAIACQVDGQDAFDTPQVPPDYSQPHVEQRAARTWGDRPPYNSRSRWQNTSFGQRDAQHKNIQPPNDNNNPPLWPRATTHESPAALQDLVLMRQAISQLQKSVPYLDFRSLERYVADEEIVIKSRPWVNYQIPANDSITLNEQLNCLEQDGNRLQSFLEKVDMLYPGCLCPHIERRVSQLRIIEQNILQAISAQQPSMQEPPSTKQELIPLDKLKKRYGYSLPEAFVDIDAVAALVSAYEHRNPTIPTERVWSELCLWQNMTLEEHHTAQHIPDSMSALCQRQEKMTNFCAKVKQVLPGFNDAAIQQRCRDLIEDGRRRHERQQQTGQPTEPKEKTEASTHSHGWGNTGNTPKNDGQSGWEEVGHGATKNGHKWTEKTTSKRSAAVGSKKNSDWGQLADGNNQTENNENNWDTKSPTNGRGNPTGGQDVNQDNEWSNAQDGNNNNGWPNAQDGNNNNGWPNAQDGNNNNGWPNAQDGNNNNEWSNIQGEINNNGWNQDNNASQSNKDSKGWKQSGRQPSPWPKDSKKSAASNNGGWSNKTKSNVWGSASHITKESGSGRKPATISVPPAPINKAYWRDWNKPTQHPSGSSVDAKKKRDHVEQIYKYPAIPLPEVPKDQITDRKYGVQASRGTDYAHLSRRPIYIDSMEAPYAVFTFRARSKGFIERKFNAKTNTDEFRKVEQSIEKDKLMSMPKDQLVDELMKKRNTSRASVSKPTIDSWASQANNNDAESQTKSVQKGTAPNSVKGWKSNTPSARNAAGNWNNNGGQPPDGAWNGANQNSGNGANLWAIPSSPVQATRSNYRSAVGDHAATVISQELSIRSFSNKTEEHFAADELETFHARRNQGPDITGFQNQVGNEPLSGGIKWDKV